MQPASVLRANGPGDSWNYSVSITYSDGFGTYTGTLAEALTSDTYNNQPTVRSTRTFNLTLSSGPATITSYSEVGMQGQLLAEFDNGTLEAVTGDTFQSPATLGPGVSASGTVTLADGTSLHETYRVVGSASVMTAEGAFNCWVVDQEVDHSDGTKDVFTAWIAPETGNYVKLTDTTTQPGALTYSYTVSLTSMVSPTAEQAGLTAGFRQATIDLGMRP